MNIVQNTLNATTTLVLIDVPFVIIFLIALFLIHYQLGIIVSLFIFVPFMIMNYYRKRLSLLSQVHKTYPLEPQDYTTIQYQDLKPKYFNLVDAIKRAWASIVEKNINTKENLEALKNIITSFMSASTTFLTIVIIAWCRAAVDGQISVGALIGANILGSRAIAPVIKLMQNIEPLNNSKTAIFELNKFLNLPQDLSRWNRTKRF